MGAHQRGARRCVRRVRHSDRSHLQCQPTRPCHGYRLGKPDRERHPFVSPPPPPPPPRPFCFSIVAFFLRFFSVPVCPSVPYTLRRAAHVRLTRCSVIPPSLPGPKLAISSPTTFSSVLFCYCACAASCLALHTPLLHPPPAHTHTHVLMPNARTQT